jgi:hypothetical protein
MWVSEDDYEPGTECEILLFDTMGKENKVALRNLVL